MVAPLEDAIHKRRRANKGEAKSKKTAKERDKKETREMFGPCCDKTYVYETSCRNADPPSRTLPRPLATLAFRPSRGEDGLAAGDGLFFPGRSTGRQPPT